VALPPEEAQPDAGFEARLARLAAAAPHGGVLDYFVDSPMTRDPANFIEADHYRASVARTLEGAIARLLSGQGGEGQARPWPAVPRLGDTGAPTGLTLEPIGRDNTSLLWH